MALKRINNEIKKLQENPVESMEINFNPSDLFKWEAFISGPQGSPYDDVTDDVKEDLHKVVPMRVTCTRLPLSYPQITLSIHQR